MQLCSLELEVTLNETFSTLSVLLVQLTRWEAAIRSASGSRSGDDPLPAFGRTPPPSVGEI